MQKKERQRLDLNQQPPDLESGALPIELLCLRSLNKGWALPILNGLLGCLKKIKERLLIFFLYELVHLLHLPSSTTFLTSFVHREQTHFSLINRPHSPPSWIGLLHRQHFFTLLLHTTELQSFPPLLIPKQN